MNESEKTGSEARLSLALPRPMRTQLEKLAAANDRSISAEVRRAVFEHLAEKAVAR